MKVAFVCVLSLVSGLFASQKYESYYERYEVTLYQLQVNVQDKDGLPIKGLTKEDFQLKFDGKTQKIESVSEIDIQALVQEGDRAKVETFPDDARRVFVFFFDLRYSKKSGLLAARRAAQEFVRADMLPTDLVGIFVYTQLSGINMVSNFTNDRNQLDLALSDFGLSSGKHVIESPAGFYLQGLLDDFAASSSGTNSGNKGLAEEYLEEVVENAGKSESKNYQLEVQNFLKAFKAFGEGLKYMRGRKNLLWFSSGFDSSSLVGASMADLRKNSENFISGNMTRVSSTQFGDGQIQGQAQEVVEALQASGTIVFAIDTGRLDGLSVGKSGLQTLNFFSVDTGGRVYTNSNDLLPSINEVKEITNNYYLLSFYPEAKLKPGEVGSLKVDVKTKGAKVFSNKGLLLQPDFKNMNSFEKQVLLSEFIGRDEIVRAIPVNVGVWTTPMDKTLVKLNVSCEIEGGFFAATKGYQEYEVFNFLFNKENQIFDQTYFRFSVDPSKLGEELTKGGVRYFATLFAKQGTYKLKTIVRDATTGRIGSWISEVKVPEVSPVIAGPVLLAGTRAVLLRDTVDNERKKRLGNLDFSYPFLMEGKYLIPDASNEVSSQSSSSFYYLLRYRKEAADRQSPQIAVALMDEKGSVHPIPSEAISASLDQKNDATLGTSVVLSIDFSKLKQAAGTYSLMAQFQVPNQPPMRSMSQIKLN